MPDLIGQRLGQYVILEQIGKGGMATVYKAEQTSLQRTVAVKVLPAYFAHDETFRERFFQEARAVGNLNHPHILAVYDFGQTDELAYIVMEYVKGGTLGQIMGRPLSIDFTARIIEQIGGALDYAHRNGVIHRDVKPGNIMLREDGETALLADFGLAKMAESKSALTRSGVGVGTPEYLSPEQGQGQKVDWRTDLYSLGVVMYEMLTGRIPFEAETPLAVIIKHISEPLPHARALNPSLPPTVDNLMLKALAKDPAERFQSGAEMATAIRQVAQDNAMTVPSLPMSKPPDSQMRSTPPPPVPETGNVAAAAGALTAPFAAPPAVGAPTIGYSAPASAGQAPAAAQVGGRSMLPVLLGGLLLILVAAGGGYALFANANAPAATPTAVAIVVAPSAPSATPAPSSTPLPSATSVPATATSSATASATATGTPTATPLPPSDTPVPIVIPNTSTPRPPTNTPLPPTNTPVPAPQFSGQLAIPMCPSPAACGDRGQVVNLFRMDGTKIRTIGAATDPSYQEDGKRLVFSSFKSSGPPGNRSNGIYYFDYDNGRDDNVFTGSPYPIDSYPAYMRGGILFVSTRFSEKTPPEDHRLMSQGSAGADETLGCDYGGPCTIGRDPVKIIKNARWPSFSEANGLIAFTGCFGGGCGIWTTNTDGCDFNGRGCTQVARGGSDTAPAWEPVNGSRLAFSSHEDGTFEIYSVAPNGAGRKRLSQGGGQNVSPAWSPDGQWIAYLSDRSGQWAVWAIKPDGSGDTKVFDLGASVFDAPSRRMSWAP